MLASQGANLDTTTAKHRLVFGIFNAWAEFECELIIERTHAGLASARARGCNGGRPFKMTAARSFVWSRPPWRGPLPRSMGFAPNWAPPARCLTGTLTRTGPCGPTAIGCY